MTDEEREMTPEEKARMERTLEVLRKHPLATIVEPPDEDEEPSPEEVARVDRLMEHLKTRPFVASIDEGDEGEGEDDEVVEASITFIPKLSESQKEYLRAERERKANAEDEEKGPE